MSFYALPTMAESVFSTYLSNNYSGSYNIGTAFSVTPYVLPLILIKATSFKEVEPGTGVFEGKLAIQVQSQIDDVTDPIAVHDGTLATIADLFDNQSAVLAAVNAPTGVFHLWSIQEAAYEQERQDRTLISELVYTINCQTLAVA